MAPSTAVYKAEGCAERALLEEVRQRAEAAYDWVAALLSKEAGVMTVAEYRRIRDHSETARKTLKAARQALEKHVAAHGC